MTVEVFSGPNCNYCKRAKELLDQKGVAFTDLDISAPEHRDEFVRRLPRARAIPQIVINGGASISAGVKISSCWTRTVGSTRWWAGELTKPDP